MGGYAWVTLATNDSYSLGALVLARSLQQVGTRQQLAVIITPGVTNAMRSKLTEVFNVVQEVNLLDSKDEENLRLLKRPELGVTFTKLHCWRLTQFDKCVFLDADTLVLENCDELFDREELSAAPDIGWPDCFNSGVFVFRPSIETYEKLIRFAIEKGSFDGGDQGLLNLYFSDWAHKDISKHLPFIYNVSSTACYSYLPAFKQFGKSAKIIHFIGTSKPWLQYFDTETKKVHASEELKHLQEILQRWWDLFCTIHSSLSPEMTSHTDTVHGSQSRTFQNTAHTPHHHHHLNTPSSGFSHPAEDYQNVWDPWEEYDSRQPQDQHIQSVQSSIPEHTIYVSQNTFVEPVYQIPLQVQGHSEQVSHSYHSSENHTHKRQQSLEHQSQLFEPKSQLFDHQNQSFQHQSQSFEHQTQSLENKSQSFGSHSHHSESQRHFNENRNHLSESHSHLSESQNSSTDTQSQQNQLFESHNTNANFDADHHSHNHSPFPTYSHPQSHMSHYEAPACPVQEISHSTKPPPPDDPVPRLPDECVTTTTVSNEITLQTGSNEDTHENAAGLAGAFAKLTLGAPRTPEQAALDDHLRRQGWEVGNIDYLGKDSFDNIWSKICETLSAAAEEPVTKTESSKVEAKSKVVPPTEGEVKSDENVLLETEDKQKPASVIAQSQVVIESQIPSEAIVQPPTGSSEQVEVPKDAKVATEMSITDSPPVISAGPAVATKTPASVTSAVVNTIPETPASPIPEPPTPATATSAPVIPTPETPVAATPVAVSPALVTPPAPVTPAVVSPIPVTPAPVTPAPVTPAVVTPTPVTSASVAPAAISSASVTTKDVTSSPVTSAVETQAPVITAAVTPVPVSPAAETPVSVISAAVTPAPVIPSAVTPAPVTSAVVTAVPKTPAAVTPLSVTPTPVDPTPVTQALVSAEPVATVTSVPQSPTSVKDTSVVQPATIAKTPIVALPSSKAADVPLKEVSVSTAGPVAPSSKVPEKSSGPSTPTEAVILKDPLKAGKISRDPPKKPKEGIQAPKTQVTEPTPPTTPASPQIKDTKPALGVETVVPETPPVPAPESSTAPTPTPRKSNRSDKKTGTKTKK